MPNFVALELNDDVMVVACAKGSGRNFQINQLFELPVQELSDEELGIALKESLAEKGVTKSELIGVVNRKQVEMREVSVPPAPDNELPDLVRFQARNVFASMNDNWKLDYVPFQKRDDLPESADDQHRVLAIAISPTLYDQYSTVAEAAGLKLKRIVFGPYSCFSLYESLMQDARNRLLIVPAAGHFDFAVASGMDLVAARSIKSQTEGQLSAHQMISEVRRTIASTRGLLCEQPIEQILIGASEEHFGEIGSEIESKLEMPVAYLDVFATLPSNQLAAAKPELPEHFAAVIGSLALEYSSKSQPVDFVNPRRPIVRKKNYRPAMLGVAAVALIMLMAGFYAWFSLSSQHKKILKAQADLDNQKAQNEGRGNLPSIDQMVGEVKKLDDWQLNRTNWLDELSALSGLLLTPDDIMVTSFRGQAAKQKGALINLGIRTTKETNMTPAWKQTLFDRYELLQRESTPDDDVESDYPFSSRLTLTKVADREAVIGKINALAESAKMKELEAAEMQAVEPVEPDAGSSPDSNQPSTAE